ncbi:MAG: recombinase family protein [Segniliparus sp.]|uniref:recombinase family protein n=1 Tax=Segniliparus sp. TaxID=2804064 RepID=UPI003F2ED377
MSKRALIDIRLSRLTDATTSPERQLDDSRTLCEQRDYVIVGSVEDLDVSATLTSPFERPALQEWIGDGKNDHGRMHEIDVLVFWRMDRVVRHVFDILDLMRWCQAHSVKLVSVKEPFLDFDSPYGMHSAMSIAWVAQMESAANSERSSSAARFNTRAGKFRGGTPPWGYLPDKSSGQWRYAPDPVQVAAILEAVTRILDGESLRSVAHDFTARGELTPRDRFAQAQGREVKGYQWQIRVMQRALKSPTLLGQIVVREAATDDEGRALRNHRGRKIAGPQTVVRDDDGSPVVRSEPILTRDVFDRLQAELQSRGQGQRKGQREKSDSLLLRVLSCGECGRPMYRHAGDQGRQQRYRCASSVNREPCGNRSVTLDHADTFLNENLLDLFGDSERRERTWDAGSDHSTELADIDATLADLTDQLGSAAFRKGTPQRDRLDQRITALAGRQTELASRAVRPSGWTWTPTGEKFADWWENQDVKAKNEWLRSTGVRLTFKNTTGAAEWAIDLGDLKRFEEQLQFGEAANRAVRQILEANED